MPNTAQVIFNEVDNTRRVADIDKGIVAVQLQTLRGPFGNDGVIVNTWAEWAAKYGPETAAFEGATLIKRIFQYGGRVRTNKVGHYTTISDASTLDAVKGTLSGLNTFGNNNDLTAVQIFDLSLKYAGADYNNVTAFISDASNGQANYFDLVIEHGLEPGLNERFSNLHLPQGMTIAEQQMPENQWLSSVDSKFFDIVYLDNSSATSLRPQNIQAPVTGGTNGGTIVEADYSGDSAGQTGWHSFDQNDDFTHVASLDNFSSAVAISGSAYSASRQDCICIIHIPNSNNSQSELSTFRDTTNIDNAYTYFIAGGITINDVVTRAEKDFPEIGDVLGIAARSETDYGAWISFANRNRGSLGNVVKVVNNFGTRGQTTALNALANSNINNVIGRNGTIMVWGNFSGQLATSVKSFISNVKLGIHIRKSLGPLLEDYLEEPNDIMTWRTIFDTVAPFFDDLRDNGRAIFDWDWRGDQGAPDLDNLQINTKAEVLAGRYRVDLVLTEVVSLQEFTINIISSLDTGVEFEF